LTAIFVASSALAGAPLLHFYNARNGAIQGEALTGGSQGLRLLAGHDVISTGWTHIVHMPDSSQIFFYNHQTGSGAVAFRNSIGEYTTQRGYKPGHFTPGWDDVVAIGGNRLFFYRGNDGLAALARVDGDGNVTTVRSYTLQPSSNPIFQSISFTFPAGYSFVVHVGHGEFFYNETTGDGEYGTFDTEGAYHRLSLMPHKFSPGWSHIVYLPVLDEILYYKRETGLVALGRMDAAGNHTTLHTFSIRPWINYIVPTVGNTLFLYEREHGQGSLMVVSDQRLQDTPVDPSLAAKNWDAVVFGF
jgi:hypothetical protein